MSKPAVLFYVTCAADDPQAPARVMGIFTARGLLPRRFSSLWLNSPERIEIEVEFEPSEDLMPEFLAKVLDRIPTVTAVTLQADGQNVAFDSSYG
jgi:hypothetical protein